MGATWNAGESGDRREVHLPHSLRPTRRPWRRLRRRKRDRRAAASSSNDLAIAKGRTIDQDKRADEAADLRQIHATHIIVWERSALYCECCGDDEDATLLKCPDAEHHMHEDPSRAETAGRPPAERFNAGICGRVCACCHADIQEHRIRIVFFDPVERFQGDFDIVDWETGQRLRQMRRALSSRVIPIDTTEDLDR